MKVKSLGLICLCLTLFTFADNNITHTPSDLPDINVSIQTLKERALLSQIETLKKRVAALEAELKSYQKVKPVSAKVQLRPKVVQRKEHKRGKRFTLSPEVPQSLPVYYEASYQTVEDITFKLKSNGFKVLAQDEILKGKTVLSFTSEALTQTSSFLSVLHLLVNEGKEIRVQNPSYFAAAFLQDHYKYGDLNSTLQALDRILGGMYEVDEHYKLTDLPEYHFMFGMPRVSDTITIAKGDDLLSKVKERNASQYVSYTLALPSGAVLVGHKLKKTTYAYLKNIKAENNAQIFPYEAMIENNRVYILAPKYYLALSLPYLSMTDFLKIASAPEVIAEEIKQAYK